MHRLLLLRINEQEFNETYNFNKIIIHVLYGIHVRLLLSKCVFVYVRERERERTNM